MNLPLFMTMQPNSLRLLCHSLTVSFVLMSTMASGTGEEVPKNVDVLVYGGTPAGIAAAVAAGRDGQDVLIVEPYSHVGGLMTNGLCHSDYHSYEGLSGTFLEFANRVHDYYKQEYGPDSQQAKECRRGVNAEPSVNQLVFEQMLNEIPSVEVVAKHRLTSVETKPGDSGQAPLRILSATFTAEDGVTLEVAATIFIDASYEGDLLAAAGIPYVVGREARDEYDEPLAPETADGQVQGYNFRFIVTDDPARQVAPEAPAGYDRNDFLPLIPLLESGSLKSIWCESKGGIYKAHRPPLPNNKYDVNDVSNGLVRLSMPDISDGWPDGDKATRQEIFDAHLRHNVGMLYFLQNDDAVPERFRKDARQFGWAKDEFTDNGHIPEQLYIREARRMKGLDIYNQNDTQHAMGDARAFRHADSIAISEYTHNCHGTDHEGPRLGGRHTGEFYQPVPPYQVPYGTLVPQRCENLLVPVAVSSTHAGFCALRLEPTWMSLGQAAGEAASLAIDESLAVQDVPVDRLQARLRNSSSALIYVSDVAPDHPDFTVVQWWGILGGLHNLEPMPDKPGQRGAHITSQYYEANPGHEVQLDKTLDEKTKESWLRIAGTLGIADKQLEPATTRGDFIRTAFALAHGRNVDRPTVVLTEEGAEVHRAGTLFDGHNDLPWEMRKRGSSSFDKLDISTPQPAIHTDIERLRQGGVKAQFWSVYVPADTEAAGTSLLQTLQQIELVHAMIARYPDTFELASTVDDIKRISTAGKIASLMGIEGGYAIEESLDNIQRLHDLGCRYMTLTHSKSLSWADSATDEPRVHGLSDFGEAVVREMNRVGMLVDLSHVSPETMTAALRVTSAPVIFSHSSARALTDHPRNVPDDVLELTAENGGVVMVNFYSQYVIPTAQLRKDDTARGTIHDVVDHIEHIIDVAGIDHVGIGSDFDGVPRLPEQLDDVSTYPLITQELLNRGHSAEDIHKILGGNILRVLRQAEAVAEKP